MFQYVQFVSVRTETKRFTWRDTSQSFLIKTRGGFIWKPDPGLDLVGNLADEFKSSRGGGLFGRTRSASLRIGRRLVRPSWSAIGNVQNHPFS